jgi:hypothetical protein
MQPNKKIVAELMIEVLLYSPVKYIILVVIAVVLLSKFY